MFQIGFIEKDKKEKDLERSRPFLLNQQNIL